MAGLIALTPVDITPATKDAWVTVDLSTHVPTGTPGVALLFHTTTSTTAIAAGIRKPGSTDARTSVMRGQKRLGAHGGLDSSRSIELFVGSAATVTVYLTGYYPTTYTFLTNAITITPGTLGSFQTVSVASHTGAETAIGVFLELTTTSASAVREVRKKGVTTALGFSGGQHQWPISGVDAAEELEANIPTGGALYLVGWFTDGAVFPDTYVNDTPTSTSTSYQDLSALPEGANGGIYIGAGGADGGAVRRKGDTVPNNSGNIGPNALEWWVAGGGTDNIVEGLRRVVSISIYRIGYWLGDTGGGPPPTVTNVWASTHGDTIVAGVRLSGDGDIRLAVSTSSDLSSPTFSAAPVTTVNSIGRVEVSGLNPDTVYHFDIEVDGTLDAGKRGQIRTFQQGAHSFRIAFASCATTGSTHEVFNYLRTISPSLNAFFHLGDMHYQDINTNDASIFQSAFDSVLASTPQALLYRNVPLFYMWDDHDFGPNNSNKDSTPRSAAIQAYRARVPYPPLALAGATDSVGFSVVIGRLRVIMLDTRSSRDPQGNTDNSSKSMIGADQKTWFKSEIDAAFAAGQAVLWDSGVPWHAGTSAGADHWGGYNTERVELANYIRDAGMGGRTCVMAGDMHACAVAFAPDYASGGGAPMPVCQAAPLSQTNSHKGGAYDQGPFPSDTGANHRGQFAVMDVTDAGGSTMTVTWTLMRHDPDHASEPVSATVLATRNFDLTLPVFTQTKFQIFHDDGIGLGPSP